MTDNHNNTNDTTAEVSASTQVKPNKNKGQKRATAAIILAVLLTGSVIAFEAYQYTQSQQTINQLKAQVNQLNSHLNQQLETNQATIKKQATTLQHKLETQAEQQGKSIKSLQLAITDIKGRSPNDWLLAEADYLVKMAGRKLFLEHDVESATQLMISADQRIAALNDPSLVTLREAMTDDITQLKSLPVIDQEGLILKLISLQKEVDQLPLANALLPKEEKHHQEVVSEDINDWQTNLMTSLKDFAGHFITFRTREGNTTPLLSPTQHFYLKENVKAKLETAIKGVYAENNDIYQTSLNVAQEWSSKFFNQQSIKVKEFEKEISQLQEKDITVDYPIKLKAQQPLTDLISERLRRSVSTVGQGDK
ncbi:uroporphyrinogen-III C-methyltransferase [Vibrio sp. CK2-1]|uniref:uroporphyrinogen-III C-methyltransferase n=1 Tax=Vibrio sp. CK2-1 TaxID=2912249 RepID=UPI001F2DD404|nr:uroporphyrinogen-III C-methyltransferase [Vibrio sp. CK2-1]MCF7355735.1 uroporphyrinogen-III C-methyltransferase [Vibrio sp. CK2-1]